MIYQPGAFTVVSDGQINVPIDPNSTVVKAARDALNGWDPTNGAYIVESCHCNQQVDLEQANR